MNDFSVSSEQVHPWPLGSSSSPSTSSIPHCFAPSAKAATFPMFSKEAYWSKINEQIEAHIRRAVPLHTPPVVHQPIKDLVVSAPRTLAPALCVAAFNLFADDNPTAEMASAVVVAAALHVMYAGSRAHEFLPTMLKRHHPALHDANIELLSGDAIFPLGYEMVANSIVGNEEDAGLLVRVMVEMSRSMGAQGYGQGQHMNVELARPNMVQEPTISVSWAQEALRVSRKKEGELYACGAICGAIIGGAGKAEVERLRRYGLCVGTIHGISQRRRGNPEGAHAGSKEIMKAVDALRTSAFMELQGFDVDKANGISSILDIACTFGGEKLQMIRLVGNEYVKIQLSSDLREKITTIFSIAYVK